MSQTNLTIFTFHITRIYASALRARAALTVRLAVGHPGPGRVVVIRVSLRVQVVEENIHLVRRQQLRRGLHVVVAQAGMVVGVRVLSVQHGVVGHPAGLISPHIHHDAPPRLLVFLL